MQGPYSTVRIFIGAHFKLQEHERLFSPVHQILNGIVAHYPVLAERWTVRTECTRLAYFSLSEQESATDLIECLLAALKANC